MKINNIDPIDLNLPRCTWCSQDETYIRYHDKEWGVQVKEDKPLFEFLTLEGAQAGLSWITILKRREAYRQAFANFDFEKVALFDEMDKIALINNPGIIRNKAKINSAVTNAQAFIKIKEEFDSFYNYTMHFFPNGEPIVNHFESHDQIPVETEISKAMSKDMKKRGFSFFGSVICYAHLQATGAVNDHIQTCFLAPKIPH